MILSRPTVERYLQESREIGQQYRLYDMHVHPFELLLKPINYSDDPEVPGVLSVHNSQYRKPSVKEIDLKPPTGFSASDAQKSGQLSLQALMAYRHTGATVLADKMTLSGIGACMLLPVPMTRERVDQDLQVLERLQDADSQRLMYAVGAPAEITDPEAFLHLICRLFCPRAVKIHPNFTGIDLGSTDGRQWMANMLSAASRSGLPSIVHGGRSILLPKGEISSYACIDNLLAVDWDASERPVLISHAGALGCSLEETTRSVLPGIKELFARHPHILVDTAGLSYPVLLEVLKQLGPERVLFGSDEMYFPQWQSMAILVHACKSLWNELGQEFIRIAHENSAQLLKESTVTV